MTHSRRSFYVLLPLLAVCFTLLLAEVAFSLFYPIPFSLERNMYYEPDPHTGFRHRPDSQGRYLNGVPASANSQGHRDTAVAIPKPAGVRRILLLGDSFAAGANVAAEAAFPAVLEQRLNATAKRVEVVNTGTGGWSPFQYAQYLEHYGDRYEPDAVVVTFFVGNDSYVDRFTVADTLTAVLGRRVSRQTGQSRWGAAKVYLYEHSHIMRLLLKQGFESAKFERADCSDFNDYFLGVQTQRLANHLAVPGPDKLQLLDANVAELVRIRDWAAARDVPLVVFVLPDENQINAELRRQIVPDGAADYDFDNPQRLLGQRLEAAGIAWVDLLPAFRADGRCLYMNDSHWVAAGHALAADIMHDYLQRAVLAGD